MISIHNSAISKNEYVFFLLQMWDPMPGDPTLYPWHPDRNSQFPRNPYLRKFVCIIDKTGIVKDLSKMRSVGEFL